MATQKYIPIDYNDDDKTLDTGAAAIQAAQALDVAAVIATKTENLEALAGIANLWIMLGKELLDGELNEGESKKLLMGFQSEEEGDMVITDE